MGERLILNPEEVGELVPHWMELDPAKSEGVSKAGKKFAKVRNRKTGTHTSEAVLHVPPIIIAPSVMHPGKMFLIDGKHRCVHAILTGTNLRAKVVTSRQDILHGLSESEVSGIEGGREKLLDIFDNRVAYEEMCTRAGVDSIQDLIRKDTAQRASLATKIQPPSTAIE